MNDDKKVTDEELEEIIEGETDTDEDESEDTDAVDEDSPAEDDKPKPQSSQTGKNCLPAGHDSFRGL